MASLPVRERIAAMPAYSYRDDRDVPPFPDDRAIIVFDGICVLCSGFARFVARHDRSAQFRFTAAQSPLGIALFRHYGLDTVNYETNLLITDGRAFAKMDAFDGIMRRLGGPMRLAALTIHLPDRVRDRLYDLIARNRYKLFGRRDSCIRPDAGWQDRIID